MTLIMIMLFLSFNSESKKMFCNANFAAGCQTWSRISWEIKGQIHERDLLKVSNCTQQAALLTHSSNWIANLLIHQILNNHLQSNMMVKDNLFFFPVFIQDKIESSLFFCGAQDFVDVYSSDCMKNLTYSLKVFGLPNPHSCKLVLIFRVTKSSFM